MTCFLTGNVYSCGLHVSGSSAIFDLGMMVLTLNLSAVIVNTNDKIDESLTLPRWFSGFCGNVGQEILNCLNLYK